ncbi:MAG: metallophosphoesterase [Chloroherpetonaceae bacterium]|nr:metallophosphoesterase [Chloroherpetonaceae bacterium]MCS7211147.1 metallophosphoesterase [Chloroherpetonaceae bacterium]
MSESSPLFSFGIITDIQYANLETQGRLRFREVPEKLRAAVEYWNRQSLAFVVQLGDIVHGNGAETYGEFQLIASILERTDAPCFHLIGNHCLSVRLEDLLRRFQMNEPYYAFSHKGFRFIALYGMDISIESDGEAREKAREFLAQNPTMREWCGALSETQLTWLESEIRWAEMRGERIVFLCHFPVHWQTTDEGHGILWNYAEVQSLIFSSPNSAVWFNGHYHKGAETVERGVHFISLEALVEAPEGSNAFGIVEVYPDRLVLHGEGAMKSRMLCFSTPLARLSLTPDAPPQQ